MAAQPDINAILAALAAQNRAGSTPSQAPPAPPVGMPQAYAPAIPQQTGTPSLGGFALPQPTSSGSVDLSSVRPVSTGSVSIAEAIAKARSIAADKNIGGPPRDDPRLAGRSYRRSRSRSRSPQRRDGFRDNYNPYRDERRGEDRRSGGFGGRDRSRSPNRGGQGYGGGGGGGGGDKDSDTITVKSALVGLIIGRGGENLRRVEQETGARVQFIPAREPGAPQRQCTISGTQRQVAAAKREIFHTIEENGGTVPGGGSQAGFDPRARPSQPPSRGGSMTGNAPPVPREGEHNRQILVPDKTVGLIIGRGGETIRDLQDRSGCHVNIVGENKSINGRRPVNLIGTREAADKAEGLIWEIVDSDERVQSERAGRPAAPPSRDPYSQAGGAMFGGGGLEDDKINESIRVPSQAVGMIIGKGGESIKDMQNKTGCKINVNQPGNPDIERQIDLVGSRTAIEAAKRVIFEKVDTVQQRDSEGGGRGGRNRDDGYQQQQQQQPSYGQPATQQYAMPGMAQAAAPAGGDPAADPYAAYGGYQNYMNLWYQAMAAQGAGGQPPAQ
ncbi:Far upstream element-binding protein 1 [Elsinoe australis]|uniref:Far upstream element-binding protein 1 n=1 Tax=Elsinoe australis TaxID=40998 RepID=A0A2P7YMS7_9PEZI|nr:Far upstream element-binding protein 1 [Elsinoe australis]